MRMKDQLAMGDRLLKTVYAKYHAGYNNDTFSLAIKGKGSAYANALIDEALALCGSPYEKLSFRRWAPAAIAFLKRFAMDESGISNGACNIAPLLALLVFLVVVVVGFDIPVDWGYLPRILGI